MFVVNGEPCSTVANECIGSGGRGDLRSDSAWTLPNLSSLFYFGWNQACYETRVRRLTQALRFKPTGPFNDTNCVFFLSCQHELEVRITLPPLSGIPLTNGHSTRMTRHSRALYQNSSKAFALFSVCHLSDRGLAISQNITFFKLADGREVSPIMSEEGVPKCAPTVF